MDMLRRCPALKSGNPASVSAQSWHFAITAPPALSPSHSPDRKPFFLDADAGPAASPRPCRRRPISRTRNKARHPRAPIMVSFLQRLRNSRREDRKLAWVIGMSKARSND